MGHNYGCIAHGLTSAHRGALSDGTNATSCVHKSPSAEVNPQQGQMYGSQLRLLLVWLHIMTSSAAPRIVLAVPTVQHYGLRKETFEWCATSSRLRQDRGAPPARPVEPPRLPGQIGDPLLMAPVRPQGWATTTAARLLVGGFAPYLGDLLPLALPRLQGPVVEGLAIGAPAVRGVSHSAPVAPR